jgi:hypothetical protein
MVGKGQSKKGPAMSLAIETRVLGHKGAQTMLAAAIAQATDMNVPQCISTVDAGSHLLPSLSEVGIGIAKAPFEGEDRGPLRRVDRQHPRGRRHQPRDRDAGLAHQPAGRSAGDHRRVVGAIAWAPAPGSRTGRSATTR